MSSSSLQHRAPQTYLVSTIYSTIQFLLMQVGSYYMQTIIATKVLFIKSSYGFICIRDSSPYILCYFAFQFQRYFSINWLFQALTLLQWSRYLFRTELYLRADSHTLSVNNPPSWFSYDERIGRDFLKHKTNSASIPCFAVNYVSYEVLGNNQLKTRNFSSPSGGHLQTKSRKMQYPF